MTKTRRNGCAKHLLSNRSLAVPIIKWKVTFLGPGTKENKNTQGLKESQLFPSLLLMKDTLSNFGFWKSFPSVYIQVVLSLQNAEGCSYETKWSNERKLV